MFQSPLTSSRPAFRREGELGDPGSTCPENGPAANPRHAAQDGSEDVTARSVSRCVRCSQTIGLRASCRPYTRTCNGFARATVCVEEMSLLYLLEMLLLYLLAAVCEDDLSQELTFITDVGGFAEFLYDDVPT